MEGELWRIFFFVTVNFFVIFFSVPDLICSSSLNLVCILNVCMLFLKNETYFERDFFLVILQVEVKRAVPKTPFPSRFRDASRAGGFSFSFFKYLNYFLMIF
jgi:hypothetical protein